MGRRRAELASTSRYPDGKMDRRMRILHTADWHLGDRLGRIDRTDDLRRAVERLAGYCAQEKADVLVVAGDLFSGLSRPDDLRESIAHLQQTFEPFLLGGGTILAITGDQDGPTFCQTLALVMHLAAPGADQAGDLWPGGRFYLAAAPTFLRLQDADSQQVQFLLLPYPTPTGYLPNESAADPAEPQERDRRLQAAYLRQLAALRQHPAFRPALPTVLVAHIQVTGAEVPQPSRVGERPGLVLAPDALPAGLAYVALGHVHRPQCVAGQGHVRYAGSIERLDLGEGRDEKGVVRVDMGRDGRRGEPQVLPLDATPIYAVELGTPLQEELHELRQHHAEARRDLVQIRFRYTPGVDNLEATLRQLDAIFPRWYDRLWTEAKAPAPGSAPNEAVRAKSFEDTVRDYLKWELLDAPAAEREALLARAEALMNEVQA
jgi:exonuclease SbcD